MSAEYYVHKINEGRATVKIGERGQGRTLHMARVLEELANERRALFIKDLKHEIENAIGVNHRAYGERVRRLHMRNANEYEDPTCELIRGKMEALMGMLHWIEDQELTFTYHDNDPTEVQ